MVKSGLGQVPGLVSIEANKPLPISASRTKGYDMAVVAVLEGAEHIAGYATKAAQQYVFLFPSLLIFLIIILRKYVNRLTDAWHFPHCIELNLSVNSFSMIPLLLIWSTRCESF